MGALDYNRKKVKHPDIRLRAEILDSNFASFDHRMIKAEVDAVRQLRPNLNRYVYHTSLNFSKQEMESLTNEKLLAIAHDYLNDLGFNNNQYLLFRHYDADHPHLHHLVNRITFDRNIVSDSNNYKSSEALVRMLELKYNLIPVEQSIYKAIKRGNKVTIERNSHVSQRALKKNEIEKALRTGQPSDKMVLQEKLNSITGRGVITLQELVINGEEQGIHFQFNQASTGYISGITYFHNDFKAKGQALGNRFKWAGLIKHINYEQDRDRQAISEANDRTTAKYGKTATATATEARSRQPGSGVDLDAGNIERNTPEFGRPDYENGVDAEGSLETGQAANLLDIGAAGYQHIGLGHFNIEIVDDEDDAKRRRRKIAR